MFSRRRWTGLFVALLYLGVFFGGGLAHVLQLSEHCGCTASVGEGPSYGAPLPKDHDFVGHQDDCGICRVISHSDGFIWAPSAYFVEHPKTAQVSRVTLHPLFESFAALHSPRGPPQLPS